MPTSYPTALPDGKCTAAQITEDYGQPPAYEPTCHGAWALTEMQACPSADACETADVFRWTAEGWRYRGNVYAYCATSLTASGMPLSIAYKWTPKEADLGCAWQGHVQPEPSTGPLQKGDEGERVRVLQQRLIDLKILDDVADGQYGPNTEAAVTDLQYLVGLPHDGIAEQATHVALGLSYP